MSSLCLHLLLLCNSPAGPVVATMPVPFQGEWREDPKECGAHTEAALVIGAQEIRYLEMLGEVLSVRVHGPRSVTVTVRLAGDPPQERTERLVLAGDGNGLSFGDEGAAGARTKCP